MKRHRSLDAVGERSSRARSSKTSSEGYAMDIEAEQLLATHQTLDIKVTLRSATKAARNDPKHPRSTEEWQRLVKRHLDIADSGGDPIAWRAAVDMENPRVSGSSRDGQHPAQDSTPVGPAPTAHSRQPSRESKPDRSNQDDDSRLDDDQSRMSDEDEDGSEDLDCLSDDYIDDEYPCYEDLDGLSDDFFGDEFPWYEELDAIAKLKPSTDSPTISRRAGKQIGKCFAKLIRRDKMRESFWFEMEKPAQETADLAFDLFDRYGRLNSELYGHDINKGTGVWGNELDHGDLLLFEELTVDAAYRRRGIGTKLVNAILKKTRKKVEEEEGFFALARPGLLWREVSHLRDDSAAVGEAQEHAEKGGLAFWHAMGFRRVGTSSWLAWTDAPGHPSRQLGIAQDWACPDYLTADVSLYGKMEQLCQKLADPAIEAAECIEQLRKALPEDFEDAQWQIVDKDGDTLLHIASSLCKPELVSFLVSSVPRLTAVRNKKGHTALESLQNHLERWRTRRDVAYVTVVTSDEFKGFDAPVIECLAALEHTAAFDLSILSPRDIETASSATEEHIRRGLSQFDIFGIQKTLRYKYGCTCGQCIGGFLSPRMKLALLCVAEFEHDGMSELMDETGSDWVAFTDHLLTHLPRSVRKNLKTNKSMRQGFANMFSHFARCLEKGRIPSEREVLDFYQSGVSEWPPVTRNYLERGGSVAAVANAIFEQAMNQDEWAGDGGHRESFEKDIDKLVACRNDHEFGFVAGMCGYKRVTPGSSNLID